MRPGTFGFVGERLREAREARGLAAIALAQAAGVSRQAISQYEHGLGSPGPDVMARIARELDLPTAFFLRRVRGGPEPAVFYRSLASATKAARSRAQARFGWAQELLAFVREFIETPAIDFPEIAVPDDLEALTGEQIEVAAKQARRHWKLRDGPISNVVWLLENHGAVIVRDQLATRSLDAFSAWVDDTPFIVLGADKGSAARSRLDATHEFGHLVLHRQVTPTPLARPHLHKLIEAQAFHFGRAFLLPEQTFSRAVYSPTLDALLQLKKTWGTSVGVMLYRLQDLGLASAEQMERLWLSYGRRGWRRQEPFDDEMPAEEPRLLRQAYELMISEGVQTRAEILAQLPFAQADIEQLAALEPGYLSERPPAVRLLRPVARLAGEGKPRAQPGEIVPFSSVNKRN